LQAKLLKKNYLKICRLLKGHLRLQGPLVKSTFTSVIPGVGKEDFSRITFSLNPNKCNMKTKGIRVILLRGLLLIILSLYFIVVFGQTPSLVSFNASKKAENIALQWRLTPANNLSTIIIERKTTDSTFQAIAEFWVNFDGNTETNFNYTDKKVKAKSAQYRLRCIAADGKVQISQVVSARDISIAKPGTKPSAVKIKEHKAVENKLYASNTVSIPVIKSEQQKYLLLIQLQERENNLL